METHHMPPLGTLHHQLRMRTLTGLYSARGKRVLDIILVLSGSILVVPLVLLLAALVMLDGHAPFYAQKRVGRQGKVFTFYKLRSMHVDNEAILTRHLAQNPKAQAEWHKMQKLKDDPRITPVGRVLRKTSLDELPQLWNVLIGDMSLVGPRPILPGQSSGYPGLAYYALRPGITGPWQVSDRNAVSFASRSTYDTDYFHNLRFWQDIRYITQTFGVMLRQTGC